MENMNKQITEKLNNIEHNLLILKTTNNELDQRLKSIEERLDNIQGSTKRMDAHIHFITSAYMILRRPISIFQSITDKLAPYVGYSSTTKQIEDQTKILNIIQDNTGMSLPDPPDDQWPIYKY